MTIRLTKDEQLSLQVDYACRTWLLPHSDSQFVQEYSAKVVHVDDSDLEHVAGSCQIWVVRIDLACEERQAVEDVLDAHSQDLCGCIPLYHHLGNCDRIVRLYQLRVEKELRRRGLGSAMVMRFMLDFANENTCAIVDPKPILEDLESYTGDPNQKIEEYPEWREAHEALKQFYGDLQFKEHEPTGLMFHLGEYVFWKGADA